MKTLKSVLGFAFGCLTTITLATGVLLAGLLGIIPGLLWLFGDWVSDKETSKWLDEPFNTFKDHLREAL